jgi:hypothetical protein
MPLNDEDNKQFPNRKGDDLFLYILIGLMSAFFTSNAEPQRRARPDTGEAAARAIVARHDTAIGRPSGRDTTTYTHTVAVTEMNSRFMTMTEIWIMRPNRILMHMTIPRLGKTVVGYNGAVAWTDSPLTGPVLLEGEQLKQFQKQTNVQSPTDLGFKTLSAGKRTTIEGKRVVPVSHSDSGGNSGTLYFDVATGLLHASRTSIGEGAHGDSTMLMVFGDYKRFDGILTSTTMTIRTPAGHNIVTRTALVDHLVIDTSRFTPPPAVLSLTAKSP